MLRKNQFVSQLGHNNYMSGKMSATEERCVEKGIIKNIVWQ